MLHKKSFNNEEKKIPIWSLPFYPIKRDDSYLVKLLAYHEKKEKRVHKESKVVYTKFRMKKQIFCILS